MIAPEQPTLLIVDDSPEDRELYRRYLLHHDEPSYTLLEASLGQQGLDLWQQHQPAAVLLDYRLPDLDGLEFLSRLQSLTQRPYLPVIMVTGQGSETIAVQAMKAGAQDYLIKEQITSEGLHLAVSGAIETVRLRTELQQRIERERVIGHITRQIYQSLDLDGVLQTAVTEVRQFLNTDRVLVFQLQPDGNGTVVAESVGSAWRSLLSSTIHDPCLAENYLRFSRPGSITHDPEFVEDYVKRYRQGQVTAIPDIHASDIDPCHVELLAQFQVKANLVVPILHDDIFWGLLIAHDCTAPRLWQPLEIDLLKELATQLGIALRQAELYQQSQAELAERKRVEVELQASEARFRQLAENIDVVFWVKEVPENHVTYVSPAYERLWGLNLQDLYESQQSWINYIHPDDREVTDRAFHEKAGMGQFDQEYRIVLPDGRIRWVRDRCFPLQNQVGETYRFTGIAEDITDRKRSEQALRESEERFRTSVENMLDCFAIYQAIRNEQGEIVDFRTEYVNDAACLGNQLTREQQIGRGLCELLPGHRDSGLFDAYCQVVETGQPLVKDSLVYEDDYGQQRLTRAFDIRIAKFGDGFIATWRDITDRKQTEEALRQNEQLLRLALTGAQAGSWDWELITNKIVWSSENFDLYGLTPTPSIQYEDWANTLHPDDRERMNAETWRFLGEKQAEYRVEFRIIHSQRGIRWLQALGRLIVDEQGEPIRLSGINLDITDRKLAEDALQQSEAFNRRILESSSDCIKLFNLNGQLLYMNPGGLCMMEIDDIRPYINVDWASLWQEEMRETVEAVIDIAQTGELTRFQGFCPTAKGTPKWWDVVVTPIFNPEGQVIQLLATSRDITDRKQSEIERDRLLEQEQAARASAERANRIKDEFLAVLSHELRSPLNPILGWTKLMQTRKFDPAKTAEALATIERNAKLQTQLIDDLLDVAKILRGKFNMDTTPVDLAFVIEAAIDTVRAAAVAKDILLHPVLPQIGRVSGDAARLQQIVWNLLSNAIKFTPIRGQVEIRLERDGNQAKITVCDTGKGIAPDFLPHIFESFRQEDASTTRQYGGLGLGLAIVRHLVEAHGGTIWADSQGEGLGATFIVQFPLLDAEPEQIQSEAVSVEELDLTGVRILAVDDEPDARDLLAVILTQYGAEVLAVTSATEVLANLESFQPDVLISDIGMPGVDGYMLMQQIRTLPSEKGGQIAAIALTAYAREEDYQQAITSGYQRHMTKPLDPDHLVRAMVELRRTITERSTQPTN